MYFLHGSMLANVTFEGCSLLLPYSTPFYFNKGSNVYLLNLPHLYKFLKHTIMGMLLSMLAVPALSSHSNMSH